MYTPKSLAREAGVDVSYIRRLCRDGRLRCIKPGGRDWLIHDEIAERFVRERRTKRES